MRKLLLIVLLIVIVLLLIKRKDMSLRQSIMKTIYPLIMLKGKLFAKKADYQSNDKNITPPVSFYTLHVTQNNGTIIDLNEYKGKKILIVNTASDCGYTGQFDDLEKLHQQNKDLVILGFPANDFKQQEKKDDKAIAEFCKVNYGVTFPLMQKTHVIKGAEQNAVFKWLSDPAMNGWCAQQPVWNFNKYLVNEEGVLVGYFSQNISPLDTRVIK